MNSGTLITLLYNGNCCYRCHGTRTSPFSSLPFCDNCIHTIHTLSPKEIIVGERTIPLYAVGAYRGLLKFLIRGKHTTNPLSSYYLGTLMGEMMHAYSLKADLLIPVPQHWLRTVSRTFSPTNELATIIGKKNNIPVLHGGRATRFRFPQEGKTIQEREKFPTSYFSFSSLKEKIAQKSLCIIDDMYHTGGTARSLASTLLCYQPKQIIIFVGAIAYNFFLLVLLSL